MNKRYIIDMIAVCAAVVVLCTACIPSSPKAAEPGVQMYSNNATSSYTAVREITTPSGRKCVIVQGYKEAAITCDWTK